VVIMMRSVRGDVSDNDDDDDDDDDNNAAAAVAIYTVGEK